VIHGSCSDSQWRSFRKTLVLLAVAAVLSPVLPVQRAGAVRTSPGALNANGAGDTDFDDAVYSDGVEVDRGGIPKDPVSATISTVYAPWYYESVSDAIGTGGQLVDCVLSFVSVRNVATVENTLQITYLSGAGEEDSYGMVVSAGEAVAWSPYSDAGGAEMAGIPNTRFSAGSVRIDSTDPLVGRVIQVEVSDGAFISMASQPLVRPSESNEMYAPWYYESVSDAIGDGGELVDCVLSFVSVRNAAAEANTLQITYLSGAGDEEGPYGMVVSPGEAVAWSPYSDAGGAEMPGIPNASFAAGSVRVDSSGPIVGRVIQVEVRDGAFISMASQPLVRPSQSNEMYAPWYYESVSDAIGTGGELVDCVLSFVSVRNAAAEANTLQITYLSGAGDEEGPYEVVVSAGEAVAWSPYSDAGGAEMPGIANASFAAGSVKIESTHPVVGRVIQVEVSDGAFISMASQPLVGPSESNEVYAPWYYESMSDAIGDGGELVDGVLSFVSVRNAADVANTLQITYLSGDGEEEGPYEVVVSAGEAVAWSPYSDAGGAEMPGIPNASFAAGSVRVDSTGPIVGRVIQVEIRDGAFISMASQPLVEN